MTTVQQSIYSDKYDNIQNVLKFESRKAELWPHNHGKLSPRYMLDPGPLNEIIQNIATRGLNSSV